MKIKYYPLNLVDQTARGGNSGESHLLSAEGARLVLAESLRQKDRGKYTELSVCVFPELLISFQ